LGSAAAKRLKRHGQHGDGKVVRNADPEHDVLPRGGETVEQFVVQPQHPPGVPQNGLSVLGRARGPGPLDEFLIEHRFETLDLQADRRLGAAKLFSSSSETAGFNDRQKGAEKVQIHVTHCPPRLCFYHGRKDTL
jgi:hypothetical protein